MKKYILGLILFLIINCSNQNTYYYQCIYEVYQGGVLIGYKNPFQKEKCYGTVSYDSLFLNRINEIHFPDGINVYMSDTKNFVLKRDVKDIEDLIEGRYRIK